MCVTYNDDGREARYACNQMATTYGAPQCQSISARPVDEHVSALMLEALSPSAIEVSLQVAEDLELERQQRTATLEAAAGTGRLRGGSGPPAL